MSERLSESRLANWLHGVTLDPDHDDLDVNFERMVSIVGSLTPANVLDVLAYAYGRPFADDLGFTVVLSSVRADGEEDWVASSGDALPRRLAAAAIGDLIDQAASDTAVVAALAIRSAEFCGYQAPLTDLPGLAVAAISRIATERRRRPSDFEEDLEAEVEPQIAKASVSEADPVDAAALRQALEKVRGSVRKTVRRVDAMQALNSERNRVTEEELDVLWWSHGRRSELLQERWTEVGEAAVLVGTYEFASRLLLEPPPRSAEFLVWAVLEQAGLDPGAVRSLRDTIEAAPELGSTVAAMADPYKLLPISTAVLECRKKGGEEVWADAFKAEFGLDPAQKYEFQAIVGQFLVELSLTGVLARSSNES
jgi:hypothetical protein